jgi:hypothetical protein
MAAVLWITPGLALAQPEGAEGDVPVEEAHQERRPFAQGDTEVGLILGLGAGGGTYGWAAGGSFAYYVLPGLAPGLEVTVQGGGEGIPTETWTLVPLKWVLVRSYDFAPYLVAEGGRIFVNGYDDLWIAGGGPGVHIFSSRHVGLKAQGIFYRLFPADVCDGLADGCTGFQLGLGLGFVL